ncbi:MAG: hypothetical protein ACOC47_05760 [Alkalispirochaetaceae bacterium]
MINTPLRRPILLLLVLLLPLAGLWGQAEEGEEEEDQVTISWGEREEMPEEGSVLDVLPGGGSEAEAGEEGVRTGMELPNLQYAAGISAGSVFTTTETESTSSSAFAASGRVLYALKTPIIGSSFRSGTGQQVGALVVLSGSSDVTSILGVIESRFENGLFGFITGSSAGLGVTREGGFAASLGTRVTDRFIAQVIYTVNSITNDAGETELDFAALFGVEYVF